MSDRDHLPWMVYAAGAPRDRSNVGATLQTVSPIIDEAFTSERYIKALEVDAAVVKNWVTQYLPSGTQDILREKLLDKVPDGAILQTMPHSEVCMHMRVAGKRMFVAPIDNDMAQLYTLAGEPFSFPITRGEAGIRYDTK